MKIVCVCSCMAVKRDWLWYKLFHRDGVPDFLIGDSFSMYFSLHLAISSLSEIFSFSTIFLFWILAFPMWCKPSLDDIWSGKYLEVSRLTFNPTWCVPSTDEAWVFWLSLDLLSNGTMWFIKLNLYCICNKIICCWILSWLDSFVIWGSGLELKMFFIILVSDFDMYSHHCILMKCYLKWK